jgi:proline iminopeptidase
MEALRHYLGLGPIVSIGTSYGGMVAMAHAARYPEAVSHLILNVTASHAGLINRAREVVANRGSEEQITECDKLFGGLLDTPQKLRAYFEIMGPLYSVKGDAAGLRLGLDRAILTTEALNRAFAPDGFLHTFDLRTQLSSITAPTLILAGRHDWICAPEFSEEIHKLIPWSDLRIFEESGHFVATDEPQKLRDMISGFALSVPRRTTRWRNNCE